MRFFEEITLYGARGLYGCICLALCDKIFIWGYTCTAHAMSILLSFRECAVKFNDYFEFPRDIDMEPFTELGLAKLQGKSLV